MRRLFWVAFGATVGVLVVRRLDRAAQALTPPALAHALADAITDLGEAVRDFAVDVREGMAEREAELRSDLGLDGGVDRAALEAPPRRREVPPGPADRLTLPTPRTGRHP